MKHLFPGYYRPTEEEFKEWWEDALFVFDTNSLFNLYRYDADTSSKLMDFLGKFKERIWIPDQVAFEFSRGRVGVIQEQMDTYEELTRVLDQQKKAIKRGKNVVENEITAKIKRRHPFIDQNRLQELLDEAFTQVEEAFSQAKVYLDECQEKQPDLLEQDPVLDRINSLFEGRIGPAYTEERRQEICKEGEQRYARKIPPGYMDDDKKEESDRFGDLFLWFQILEEAQRIEKPIILITDDGKEDWWWERRKGKTLGPRPELRQEIWSKADVPFYMYDSLRFLDYAEKYLDEAIEPEVKEEVQAVREFDSRQERSRQEELERANRRIGGAVDWNELSGLTAAKAIAREFRSPIPRKIGLNMAERMMPVYQALDDAVRQQMLLDDWARGSGLNWPLQSNRQLGTSEDISELSETAYEDDTDETEE